MPQRLTDMEILEISLVDEPANDDSKVVIVKARNAAPAPAAPPAAEHPPKGEDAPDGSAPGNAPGNASGEALATFAELVRGAIAESAPRLAARLQAFERNHAHHAHPPGRGEAEGAALAAITEHIMDLDTLTKALEDAEGKIDALEKRAADAEAALDAKDDEIAKLLDAAAAPAPTEEDVLKGVPESIRKRLADAEDGVRKLNEEREREGAIAKARSLGFGRAEEVGPLLLRVRKGAADAADADRLEELLRQAAAVEKNSKLFRALGSDVAVGADPEALLKTKVDEIRKNNPALSEAQATDLAVQAEPSLYGAYIAKRRTGGGAAAA